MDLCNALIANYEEHLFKIKSCVLKFNLTIGYEKQ